MQPTVISAPPTAPQVSYPEPGRVAVTVSKALKEKSTTVPEQDILDRALKEFKTSLNATAALVERMKRDWRFRASEQWPDQIKGARELDGRPCLTINRLPAFIKQVTNQQRQSKPAIQINPVDSGSDPKTAEVLQGLIRHIEIHSRADIAYDTACDHQVSIGRGFIRIITDWSEDNPWEQEILIKRVRNPFTVYFDPACQESDYSDARYAFVVEDIPKDEFKARYGEAADATLTFGGLGDRAPDWMPEGRVRVAEYWWVETKAVATALLSNGEEMPVADLDTQDVKDWLSLTGVTEVRRRTVNTRKVRWALITAAQVLEQKEWPGRWIPIVPVLGDEIDIDGTVDLRGMVRDMTDPQRAYNYWISAETEAIALSPKAPFIGAEGQFTGHEKKWAQANVRNWPYLEYKNITLNNTLAPPPQRQSVEPPIMAIAQAIRQADNDMKSVSGIYDASLGERGPEQSGRAILARKQQGEIGNVNWVDNLARAIRAVGRILVDLIPHIYDTPRVLRIVGIDEQPRTVMVHAGADQKPPQDQIAEGVQGVYDLAVGRYDVTISVGPSFQSRRQEAVESMTEFMKAYPPAAPAVADLLADNMDWPGAATIAKRLRKMVPPQLIDTDDEQGQLQQKLAQASQQAQQAQGLIQMMTQKIQEQTQLLNAKVLDVQSRERIAAMNAETQLRLEELKQFGAAVEGQVQAEEARLQAMYDRAHEVASQATTWQQAQANQANQQQADQQGRAHDFANAQVDRMHEAGQAEADRQHELQLTQMGHDHDQAMLAAQPKPSSTGA